MRATTTTTATGTTVSKPSIAKTWTLVTAMVAAAAAGLQSAGA